MASTAPTRPRQAWERTIQLALAALDRTHRRAAELGEQVRQERQRAAQELRWLRDELQRATIDRVERGPGSNANLRLRYDEVEMSLQGLDRFIAEADGLRHDLSAVRETLVGGLRNHGPELAAVEERRALGLSIIKAQEEERRRVAREIHDGPAQILANVVLRIDVCQKLASQKSERLLDELAQLKDLIRVSLQDVRKVIFDLRPMALDDLGLVAALRSFAQDMQDKAGFRVEVLVQGQERRFQPAFEVACFRLAQEALNNVRKHAQAQRVEVRVGFLPGRVELAVIDDGRGFNLQEARDGGRGGRFGLTSMRERVELLQGTVSIKTAPGVGTEVFFSIPAPDAGTARA